MANANKKKHLVNIDDVRVFQQLKAELMVWNVEYVASEANVAPSTIYFWLDGTTMFPRLDTIAKVARVVGFEIKLVRVGKQKPVKKTYLRVIK